MNIAVKPVKLRRIRSAWYEKPWWEPVPHALEPVAQLVEQLTFNQRVMGSNPVGLSKLFRGSSVGRAVDC